MKSHHHSERVPEGWRPREMCRVGCHWMVIIETTLDSSMICSIVTMALLMAIVTVGFLSSFHYLHHFF